ncbi:tRNA U-34 5-methylaminomethyl-2-thiouridine biosynthesis protein MnmC domain [Acinetobacter nectaris CIP 110549]|uniref:tRNA 5-methylaminomethyl-2-thiouridine biosynthesis bifunctional protein MnmC n=1 Tax=Acinetobacter nectaris CIP 110549 TaxID=1392540 RepID=V2TPV4_9GAMM|nr:bifunctional tRNA (5-methylaminomethyl-2-thiouridine)(34)-methyltransferase MnmD/FAD-dependent 5-carboxymethylaminomethyl-2-thiouridine(34) oxidoreductase MnmC [Acinetobacter nectaris]ESK39612.1 tRNA U-34 5-methylaminomethyl-2-thiouridine biosynthesis protein MnmC domain [Acinetobacter nectaris CIP 110549]
MFGKIQTAELTWQQVDGIDIPVSTQFGDVYFSKDNGLLETRHVFLNGNDLSTRLSKLKSYEYFCVGETGFGTGLNILALWQLWQDVQPQNQSHLHVVTVEKFPLSKEDLVRALKAWPELQPLAEQLISQYPAPISGCHRLNFPNARFSIDLWLGDAEDIFPIIPKTGVVNAWFLDGFAPSCNPELWQQNVLEHIVRLSAPSTTFASFSVAGIIKRGLKAHGIEISRPKGFGHKREMLKAIWPTLETEHTKHLHTPLNIAIIGAGIAGLSHAWAFANRGHHIKVYDRIGVVSGASGNPLALLNPKLCPATQNHEHLMSLSWQYACSYYRQFKAFHKIAVQQTDIKKNGELEKLINDYPEGEISQTTSSFLKSEYESIQLKNAGAVIPQTLAEEILSHPLIQLIATEITHIEEDAEQVYLTDISQQKFSADLVIVCTAKDSHLLIPNLPKLKPIRGQVSWFNNENSPLPQNLALSYGGYAMQLNTTHLILGASFHPQRDDDDVLKEDHVHNLALMQKIYPEYANTLENLEAWEGRASIRAQSADYFPLLGACKEETKIYTCSGLGSKGFLFAPLCSEIVAAQVLHEVCPVPMSVLDKLSPQRFIKKVKPKKPYYQNKKAP